MSSTNNLSVSIVTVQVITVLLVTIMGIHHGELRPVFKTSGAQFSGILPDLLSQPDTSLMKG